jgi:hypothetical protein
VTGHLQEIDFKCRKTKPFRVWVRSEKHEFTRKAVEKAVLGQEWGKRAPGQVCGAVCNLFKRDEDHEKEGVIGTRAGA